MFCQDLVSVARKTTVPLLMTFQLNKIHSVLKSKLKFKILSNGVKFYCANKNYITNLLKYFQKSVVMKVVLILCLLVAGSQANFLQDLGASLQGLGHNFAQTFQGVGEQAKQLGTQLLQQGLEGGKQIASQALQSNITLCHTANKIVGISLVIFRSL